MTSIFKIVIDGQLERAWTFAKEEDALRAEIAVSKFIQQHIQQEVITIFTWKEVEQE